MQENWVGVKYHIKLPFPADLIALHNFDGGYCGISKIEHNTYCLCYLVKASRLKQYGNRIEILEKDVLSENKYLKEIFETATFLFDKPVTISNVTFSVKKPVHDHVFYLGDCAGTIAPLSGNGMSNALRASHLLSECMLEYKGAEINLVALEKNYEQKWNQAFRKRITVGRWIQYFFCKPRLTRFFMLSVKYSKPLRRMIIRQTHGHPF